MKKILFALITISILTACKTQKQESTVIVDALPLKTYFQNSTLPAAVMGYGTKEGKMEWYAFGPSVWDGKDSINENNIFRIYSMTKAIASVAALQLVEQGLIGLDDPLDKLMPEMTNIPILTKDGELIEATNTITLRHLLTHTSGFGYEFMDGRLRTFDKKGWEYEDMPKLFEAGERWQYGTSLDWVGKIIEKISGENLETYLRKNVTGPLKMNSTWFNVPENLKENIVSWGKRDSIGFQKYPRIPSAPVAEYSAGGGLFGSPKDYLTFLVCMMNNGKYDGGQILKPETVELISMNHMPNDLSSNAEGDTHGLAWAIEDSDDEVLRSRGSGYWSGLANSYYSIDEEKNTAIVYFTNFFPFGDKETYNFYRLFEQKVYLRNENR
ncbi:serine hydrolase domain-containing protein [Gillisia hiemivivida]|uniref:Beta-lactamase family protein n=1 Tax=Gillisia hiemivivida TaxID=291190 RepID=A0A5C6ZQS9_9FLAO|nr:serine hydrolase domain-containing protein [Gillisia hiemivivida]TXD92674.1 beta-lactamase family protein [Gillisia hiemivivida]